MQSSCVFREGVKERDSRLFLLCKLLGLISFEGYINVAIDMSLILWSWAWRISRVSRLSGLHFYLNYNYWFELALL